MPSFDIVSEIDLQEVDNAVNNAVKEISQRYDFKGSMTTVELSKKDKNITINSDDEFRLKNVIDVLQSKLIKRNISIKSLEYGKIEAAMNGTVRQVVTLISGIDKEKAKKINTIIKEAKLKVQSQIQDEQVRVTGKKIDDLQEVIALLRSSDFEIPLQYVNMRS